jgi:Uma2 family endonuclease
MQAREVTMPWPEPDEDVDHVVVLPGVSWDQYVVLNDAKGERVSPRMAYLDGELELMTTSDRHEMAKKLLARLFEIWALEMGVPIIGLGQTTWRKRAESAGVEPDECYFLGTRKKRFPDLAIEIVYTSGGVDKLAIYRRLGVGEVWFWVNGRIRAYHLNGSEYEEVEGSKVFPRFDLARVARIIASTTIDGQHQAVQRFRDSLRRKR